MKLLSILASLAFFWQAHWVEHVSYEGKFKVLAPGTLTEKVDTSHTAIGKLAYHIYYYISPDDKADNSVYAVHYCQYPDGALHPDSTELIAEFLEHTMESAAASIGGKVVYSSDIQLDGKHPGKLWRIDYNNGKAVAKSKAYIVNGRFYNVQNISRSERNINPDAEKFLASFKVLE